MSSRQVSTYSTATQLTGRYNCTCISPVRPTADQAVYQALADILNKYRRYIIPTHSLIPSVIKYLDLFYSNARGPGLMGAVSFKYVDDILLEPEIRADILSRGTVVYR